MKKKDPVNKSFKSKSVQTTVKKPLVKPKSKSKEVKKQEPSFFVLLGDSFYVASSKTERRSYEQFEQKVKVASSLKKGKARGHSNFQESINMQEYVKSLSKEEKERLLRDLSKEIEPEKSNEHSEVEEKEDKMLRLTEKLESIKNELISRWDDQISKVNHSFENEQIGLEEKNEKITLIQRIKNHKIAMINETKRLFDKILTEEPGIELEKSERMANIINSLNSISSMDSRDRINLQQLHPQQFMTNFTGSVQHHFHHHLEQNDKSPHQDHGQEREVSENDLGISEIIKIEESKEESVNMGMDHLKLDLRLDQVQFGKDHYDDEVVVSKEGKGMSEEALRLQFNGHMKEQTNLTSPLDLPLSQPKAATNQQFLCIGEQNQIQIPLLMTKDRLQQIQLQKTAKQVQMLGICIKNRRSFQMSEVVVPDNPNHFTTLIDVDQFIVPFYEFLMRNYMREVIEGMNVPYGKSCTDKLYVIHQHGYVPDNDISNILSQECLQKFHMELFADRDDVQPIKIHHRALFHAFNVGLNVYRPYYELEGEVFPWNTSQKGLTFYEISEDNIEQVFEKSKMKVLEYCTNLCGLIPECEVTTVQAKKQLQKINEDVYDRVVKRQMVENYGDWAVKRVNFEAISRLSLSEEIYNKIMEEQCRLLLCMK